MKKYFFLVLAAFALVTMSQSCKKKMKDADIEAAIMAKAKETPAMAGLAVTVKDGVATMTGQCKDDACKAGCEAAVKDMKGVKSVVNNATVMPPPPPPPAMPTGDDAKVMDAGNALIKGMTGVSMTVADGIATITGVTDVAKKAMLKQALTKAGAKNVMFK
jgi:hyperosmotically inducible periplasmic protein